MHSRSPQGSRLIVLGHGAWENYDTATSKRIVRSEKGNAQPTGSRAGKVRDRNAGEELTKCINDASNVLQGALPLQIPRGPVWLRVP